MVNLISSNFAIIEDFQSAVLREGIPVEKGIVITEDHAVEQEDFYRKYGDFFTAYPDLFLDIIKPLDSNFNLFFYQRMFLRACMRYRKVYVCAPRAFSKSFISILALLIKSIFQPGIKLFICAPHINQSVKIATEKIKEIFELFPLLQREVIGGGNFGKDYVKLTFRNGSIFDVVGTTDSTRGGRRNCGLIDEIRDHDATEITEIVLPLLNVSRKTKAHTLNPNEPHQQIIFATSAGTKQSYAYDVLIETLQEAIIDPTNAFVFGCDYRVPMMHGLLDSKYIQEMKMSSTYKDESFAREYMAKWTGGSEASFFDYDRINKHRVLFNPERAQKLGAYPDDFYLLSVDVGRLSDQTIVCVHRVHQRENVYRSNLVNLYVLGKTAEDKHFERQAIDLKKIIQAFRPREVVIDGNGLGVGLLDFMIRANIDGKSGIVYPPYGVFNNKDYAKVQPHGCEEIIYILKANATTTSQIHSNCYTRINSGLVKFLIKETEAKNKLLSTKKGQKMKLEERIERVLPHEMTTRLFDEMANLRIKPTGNGADINLEMINKRYTKDKFSAFEYGLWRIKELEEELNKKWKRNRTHRTLMFFSKGV